MSDPFQGFRFAVEIAGIQEARFLECSGFDTKLDVEEYKEGGLNTHVHKLPGRQSHSNLTLKRGVGASIELWDWLQRTGAASAKAAEKKNMSVVLYDIAGTEKLRWNLIKAFPVKWSTPSMQSSDSGVLVESLELAFQEFTLVAH